MYGIFTSSFFFDAYIHGPQWRMRTHLNGDSTVDWIIVPGNGLGLVELPCRAIINPEVTK